MTMIDLQTNAPARKRTRAAVLRDRVTVRLAVDEAGPLIAEVLKDNGIILEHADWSKVFPSWLIACDGDAVIGCIQVLPARPMGWLEFLYVKPSVPFKLRAIALRKLAIQGVSTLYHHGSQYAACAVDARNKKFYDVLKKFNVVQVAEAKLMVKRLKEDD